MILLSLIFYLALSVIAHLTGIDSFFANRLYWLAALCLVSIAGAYGGAFALATYQPEVKRPLRNLMHLKGVRWICLATAVVILWIMSRWGDQTGWLSLAEWIVPVGLVALINGLGFEYMPRFLAEEEVPGKLVAPPELTPAEILQDYLKNFSWTHEGKSYSISLVIRQALYKDYASRPRLHISKWADEYVIQGICGEIRELAYRLVREGKTANTRKQASFILDFVQQCVTYTAEKEEYPQYPVETLVKQTGDCEDSVFLAAALLKVIGYKVALLLLPGHAALGIAGTSELAGFAVEHGDDHYYYCEMSAEGWTIGEISEEYKEAAIEVMVVPDLLIASLAG